jgi:Tol biopolymer transport system component
MKIHSRILSRSLVNSGLGRFTLVLMSLGSTHHAGAQTARIVFQAPVTFNKPAPKPATYRYQEIFSMNPDGSGVVQLTSTATNSTGPRWSPGQAYIAFCRSSAVWVMEAQGELNGGRSFPVATASWGGTDWSPDGSMLVFQGTNEGLYLVPVNASAGTAGTPVLFHAGSWFNPNWSPDGTKIAANGSDDGSANYIVVFDAATGAELAIFSAPSPNVALYPNFSPQWSPDGTHIAFAGPATTTTTSRSGKTTTTSYQEIFLANPDGTDITRLTHLNSSSFSPTWSPDGSTLAFRCDITGTASIYTMPLSSSTITLVQSPGLNLDWNP